MFGRGNIVGKWIILIIQSLILFSCSEENEDQTMWVDQPARNQAIANKVIWYEKQIKRTYFAYPDSSINLSKEAALFYLKEKMPVRAFKAYVYMSEIALQRMGNEYKGMVYYMEAFKILNLYNGTDSLNPYFTIDIGNLLLRHNLVEQALTNYRRALELAETQEGDYVKTVVYNNLGLTFAVKKEYDSSRFFFHKALELRKGLIPVLCAHSQAYLCDIANEQKMADSVYYYTQQAIKSLNKQSETFQNKSDLTEAGIRVTGYEVLAKICRINSDFEKNRGNFNRAMVHALAAKSAADTINRFDISSSKLLNVAQLIKEGVDPLKAIDNEKSLTDSLIQFNVFTLARLKESWDNSSIPDIVAKAIEKAHAAGSLPLEIEANRFLAQYYADHKNQALAATYFKSSLELSDSLILFNTSEKGLSEQLMLANARILEELKSRKIHLTEKARVIQVQNISLFFLTIAVLSLGLMAGLLYQQKKRLYNTNLKLIGKTIALIQSGKKLFVIPSENQLHPAFQLSIKRSEQNGNNSEQNAEKPYRNLATREEDKTEEDTLVLGNSISSNLFSGVKHNRQVGIVPPVYTWLSSPEMNHNKPLSEEEKLNNYYDSLIISIETHMRESKSYLSANLSLNELSSALKIDAKTVDEVIQLKMGCSFNDYIDEWRIREACQILTTENQNKEPLTNLWITTGFKDSTAFHLAFTKLTGVSPEFFRKNLK